MSESKEREASIKPTETKLETSDSSRTTVKAANKKEKIKKSEISNQAPLETAKNEETDTLDKKSDVTADSSHQSSNTLTQENSQMSEGFWDEESTPDPSKDVRNNVVLR